MRSSEIEAAGRIAGEMLAVGGMIASDVHAAVADRTFRALGPLGAPTRAVHDRVSSTAYATVRGGLRRLPAPLSRTLARTSGERGAPLGRSPRGALALGAVNGAFGDAIAARYEALALAMTLRHGGEDLVLDTESIAHSIPTPSARVAVFAHGLCETDAAWRLGRAPDYGERLRQDFGHTPLYLRYNSGLHISDNGRALSKLLDELVEAWPVPIEEIVLVGHSMGGLVARSACHYGNASRFAPAVRHVFCLGSPHLGAPLEKAANVASWALGRLPETRTLARLINARSMGIKDLRFGSCAEDDWCDCDADEFLHDRCTEIPFLPHASYYFVAATLSRDPRAPLGRMLGDLLVRVPSASGAGRRRRIPFEVDHGHSVGGLTHFHLLNHPAVYAQLKAWIGQAARPQALTAA